MDLPPSSEPSEGEGEVSQNDKDALLRKRILIGIAIVSAVLLLMGIRGPISIAPKSKKAQWDDFAQLLREESEILARNKGVDADHEHDEFAESHQEAKPPTQSNPANKNQTREQTRKQTPKADAKAGKAAAKVDLKSKLPLQVCYEHDCQIKAQKGFLSFNKVTSENLDGWFSRDGYFLAIRSIVNPGQKLKKADIDKRVARIKADLAEYARLKKNSAGNKAKLDELRPQIMQGWLSLPVIPPRMSLRASQQGVLGTLTARDEVMEIIDVVDGSILVKNTAEMPYSQSQPKREPYWISGIDTSELAEGQRFKPQTVFQCVGTQSSKAFAGTARNLKKFDAVDFGALAKEAIEKSSLLK